MGHLSRFLNLVVLVLTPSSMLAQIGGGAGYPVPPRPLPEDEEIALAMSAAPAEISSRADIYVLRDTEYGDG